MALGFSIIFLGTPRLSLVNKGLINRPHCRQAIQIEVTSCQSRLLLQVDVKEQEPANGDDYSSLEIDKGKLFYWQGFFWVTINKTAHFSFCGY